MVQLVCVTFLAVWSTSPPLLGNPVARLVALGILVLWFGIEVLKHPESFLRPSILIIVTIFYLVYSDVVSFLEDGPKVLTWNISFNIALMFLVIYECQSRRDVKLLRPAFWTVLATSPVWMGLTLFRMLGQRNIARIVTRSSEATLQLESEGVGGFALVYFALILVPICIYLLRHRATPKGWSRALLWVTLILAATLVFKGGYAIATILMFVAALFALLLDRPTVTSLTRVAFILGFLVPLLFFSAQAASSVLVNVSRGTMYEHKVRDVMYSLEKSDSVGTLHDRSNRYGRSYDLFVQSPLVGVLSREDVGKHSAILDRFAQYGVFFGGMFVYTLAALPFRMMKRRGGLNFGLSVTVAIVAITFASLNNVFPAFGVALFLLFPVAADYVDERQKEMAEQRLAPMEAVAAIGATE